VEFDPNDAKVILTAFADQAGVAIENARLFREMRSDLDEAQRETQRRLIREATLIEKPAELFASIVRALAQILGSTYAALEILQGTEHKLVASFGIPTDDSRQFPLTFQQEYVGRLLL